MSGPYGITPISHYDRANGVAIYDYDYHDFKNSSAFMIVLDPLTLGYAPEYDGDSFSVKIDVTSFSVAAGVCLLRKNYYHVLLLQFMIFLCCVPTVFTQYFMNR